MTALAIADGGTGATTASAALTNLGAAALAGSISQVFSAALAAAPTNVPRASQVSVTFASITALRANTTAWPNVWVEGYTTSVDGGEGFFVYMASDTTSADNGGTIIVDSAAHRYYRTYLEQMNVKWFGAVANCTGVGVGTDSTMAIQKCINAAIAAGRGIYIPAGTYRLTANINVTNANDTALLNPRPSIHGAGSRATFLVWDNGAINGLTIIGTDSGNVWAEAGASLSGVCLYKGDGQGNGLSLQEMAHFACRDVICYQWAVGNTNSDVQESVWDNCLFIFNLAGFIALRNNLTEPNGLTFLNCMFGGNQNYGFDIQNGAVANFHGGSVESNGGIGSAGATIWWGGRIIYSESTVIESNAAGGFFGTYFERNCGFGDIYLANSAQPTTLVVQGCTFNRGLGGANHVGTSCVYVAVGNNINTKVVLTGNGMGGLPRSGSGAYTPSATTPYITLTANQPILLIEQGNRYTDAVETPNWPQGDFFASISFAGTSGGGATAMKNIASFTRTGAGTYVFDFNYPATNTNYFVSAGIFQGVGVVILGQTASSLTIETISYSTGVAADVNFMNLLVWN